MNQPQRWFGDELLLKRLHLYFVLHCITRYYIVLHCGTLYYKFYNLLHRLTWYYIVLHCGTLYYEFYNLLHRLTWYYIVLHCGTLYYKFYNLLHRLTWYYIVFYFYHIASHSPIINTWRLQQHEQLVNTTIMSVASMQKINEKLLIVGLTRSIIRHEMKQTTSSWGSQTMCLKKQQNESSILRVFTKLKGPLTKVSMQTKIDDARKAYAYVRLYGCMDGWVAGSAQNGETKMHIFSNKQSFYEEIELGYRFWVGLGIGSMGGAT